MRLVLAPIQIQFNLWTIQEPACFSIATASSRATSLCHNCKCLWLSQLQQWQKKKKMCECNYYEMPKHFDQWKLHHWNTIVCAFTDLAKLFKKKRILCCGETARFPFIAKLETKSSSAVPSCSNNLTPSFISTNALWMTVFCFDLCLSECDRGTVCFSHLFSLPAGDAQVQKIQTTLFLTQQKIFFPHNTNSNSSVSFM